MSSNNTYSVLDKKNRILNLSSTSSTVPIKANRPQHIPPSNSSIKSSDSSSPPTDGFTVVGRGIPSSASSNNLSSNNSSSPPDDGFTVVGRRIPSSTSSNNLNSSSSSPPDEKFTTVGRRISPKNTPDIHSIDDGFTVVKRRISPKNTPDIANSNFNSKPNFNPNSNPKPFTRYTPGWGDKKEKGFPFVSKSHRDRNKNYETDSNFRQGKISTRKDKKSSTESEETTDELNMDTPGFRKRIEYTSSYKRSNYGLKTSVEDKPTSHDSEPLSSFHPVEKANSEPLDLYRSRSLSGGEKNIVVNKGDNPKTLNVLPEIHIVTNKEDNPKTLNYTKSLNKLPVLSIPHTSDKDAPKSDLLSSISSENNIKTNSIYNKDVSKSDLLSPISSEDCSTSSDTLTVKLTDDIFTTGSGNRSRTNSLESTRSEFHSTNKNQFNSIGSESISRDRSNSIESTSSFHSTNKDQIDSTKSESSFHSTNRDQISSTSSSFHSTNRDQIEVEKSNYEFHTVDKPRLGTIHGVPSTSASESIENISAEMLTIINKSKTNSNVEDENPTSAMWRISSGLYHPKYDNTVSKSLTLFDNQFPKDKVESKEITEDQLKDIILTGKFHFNKDPESIGLIYHLWTESDVIKDDMFDLIASTSEKGSEHTGLRQSILPSMYFPRNK